nr:hypothetical protein [Actinomycetota bacterium]
MDAALDAALAAERFAPLRQLAETPGFRQAVLNAIEALRLAGVDPEGLQRTGPDRRVTALLA